jgi:hypothetical protein
MARSDFCGSVPRRRKEPSCCALCPGPGHLPYSSLVAALLLCCPLLGAGPPTILPQPLLLSVAPMEKLAAVSIENHWIIQSFTGGGQGREADRRARRPSGCSREVLLVSHYPCRVFRSWVPCWAANVVSSLPGTEA